MKNPMEREPAITVAAVAALVSAGLGILVARGKIGGEEAAAWGSFAVALLHLVQGWIVRQRVFSPQTIRDAKLDPEAVVRAAEANRQPPTQDGA